VRAPSSAFAVVPSAEQARHLRGGLRSAGLATEVLVGEAGLCQVAGHAEVDAVMAAIVGAAGLRRPWRRSRRASGIAGQQGSAGDVRRALHAGGAASGAVLLPIDSEHNAIFQCMPGDYARGLSRSVCGAFC
jgi:1-deoxy-D-xylulose-5-phosphate reductoisomerase